MPEILLSTAADIWAAFGVYWLISAARGHSGSTPQAIHSERQVYRPLRLMLLALAFALLLCNRAAIGLLGKRFVPFSHALAIAGFTVFLLGVVIAVLARIRLGQYWSDKVTLQAGHKLIRSGPYAYVRHPIYSGVLLGIAGTALLLGEWRGLVAFSLMLINYAVKAKREEHILHAQFGSEFESYRRTTGFLVPKF